MEGLKAMSFALHATLGLKVLNYDTLWIENILNIPSTFDGDLILNSPLFIIQMAILVR
jgi:hypothetical protein